MKLNPILIKAGMIFLDLLKESMSGSISDQPVFLICIYHWTFFLVFWDQKVSLGQEGKEANRAPQCCEVVRQSV